jgi:hypothetical protein
LTPQQNPLRTADTTAREKRREDACALQSFAKRKQRSEEFRTQCFWSAMRPRIAFAMRAI